MKRRGLLQRRHLQDLNAAPGMSKASNSGPTYRSVLQLLFLPPRPAIIQGRSRHRAMNRPFPPAASTVAEAISAEAGALAAATTAEAVEVPAEVLAEAEVAGVKL
jgi:hypothetical protein